jgi:hypothetical protein
MNLPNLVLLEEVAKPYFGLSAQVAKNYAAQGKLPVPAFRLARGRRGPFYIRCSDLEAHVARRAEEAAKAAGAVAAATAG